jgi:hypothetical protein
MANVLSEVAVGYPDSPLNSSHDFEHKAPAPGKRVPVHKGESAIGAGPTPLFSLFAEESDAHQDIIKEFAELLDPKLRHPFNAKGLWLVRPDGYVALRARSGDIGAIQMYMRRLQNQR